MRTEKIDWEALARAVGASSAEGEVGSSALARSGIDLLIGPENWRAAVEHYLRGGPGAEFARHVLWLVHPTAAIEYCYEIYRSGRDLEERLKAVVRAEHAGELLVGQAVVVPTRHARVPFLVSAPTMRVPGEIAATVNVYLAFRAALAKVIEHNGREGAVITSLSAPALGAGIGGMPPARVAMQMHAAFREVIRGENDWRRSARGIRAHHSRLLA